MTERRDVVKKLVRSVIESEHFDAHPVVFPVAALIIIGLTLTAVFAQAAVGDLFGRIQGFITDRFGWLYILSMTGFLLFALWLAFGRFGRVKLGADDEEPEFGRLTWFAMLFSAGMGIGLLFWGVAEPLSHYTDPPIGRGRDLGAARESMALTIFHWGLHPWSLYAIVALALAYFGFRRGLPLSFRSVFAPLIGERVHGRIGDAIDVLAIVSTLFGVATSLGLGAMQVNAGLNHLFGIEQSTTVQVVLIAFITGLATTSVVTGLHTGIRRLSEANMGLAGLLMLFVFLAGPTLFLLNALIENVGSYLQRLPVNSFWTATYEDEAGAAWLGGWTVFYWGWWIAWSPFVGMFIARVSRGRTIREFILGVLIAPTLVGIAWLTVFGGSAIHQDLAKQEEAVVGDYDYTQFPVIDTTEDGLSIAENGDVIGPLGALYEPTPDGSLLAPDGSRVEVREIDGATAMVVAGDEGLAYVPPDGALPEASPALAATDTPLTVAEFLSEPILNDAGTGEMDRRVSRVLFVMLEQYPLSSLAALAAMVCVILFFVTSSDSASMVIDMIAAGGNPDPPVATRLFWAILEGTVAALLLLAGGAEALGALQTASITAALPFTFVLILMVVSLVLALHRNERAYLSPGEFPPGTELPDEDRDPAEMTPTERAEAAMRD